MTSLAPSFVAHYNLTMGFHGSYKRNQVEEAILATLGGGGRDTNAPDLRVRMKRLLDADRLLGRDAKSPDPERASYAFYSDESPGSGVEVWFSPYEAFALQIALRLLAHGWPQGTVVRLMREVRSKLEAEHRRILEQDASVLFDQGKVRKQAAREESSRATPTRCFSRSLRGRRPIDLIAGHMHRRSAAARRT